MPIFLGLCPRANAPAPRFRVSRSAAQAVTIKAKFHPGGESYDRTNVEGDHPVLIERSRAHATSAPVPHMLGHWAGIVPLTLKPSYRFPGPLVILSSGNASDDNVRVAKRVGGMHSEKYRRGGCAAAASCPTKTGYIAPEVKRVILR